MSTRSSKDVSRRLSRKNHDDNRTEERNFGTTRTPPRTNEKFKQKGENSKLKQDSLEAQTITKALNSQNVKRFTKDTGSSRKPLKATSESSVDSISSPKSKTVIKTQFFPSKNHYSEILKHLNKYEQCTNEIPEKSRYIGNRKKDVQLCKINNKSEFVKQDNDLSEPSSTSERPRTSTLRKGIIVNHNIAGPDFRNIKSDLCKNEDKAQEAAYKEEESMEYEDDFESYESDFENCSSSDSTVHDISEISSEKISSSSSPSSDKDDRGSSPMDKSLEKKLDSGNFDLNENKGRYELSKQVVIDDIQTKPSENNFRSNLTSLSDEGFEESKSLQFLNFAEARKKHDIKKCLQRRKKRGEELLNMIKLDHINFIIFDLLPVSYENYIRHFGNLDSIQVGVQTGEDNIDNDMQTDMVEMCSKWVQMPPRISNLNYGYYKFERIGVGPNMDGILKDNVEIMHSPFNARSLDTFLIASGELILNILRERNSPIHSMKESTESFLNNGFIQFESPPECLGQQKISLVVFSTSNPSIFFSVHVDEFNEENSRSIVSLWNVNDAHPKLKLTCYGKITSCCFGPNTDILLAGLENGLLVVWETRSSSLNYKMSQLLETNRLKSPTFLTPIETSHGCRVIDIKLIFKTDNYDLFDTGKQQGKQLCSSDYEGDIIVWSILAKHQLNIEADEGHLNWENVVLYKSFRISLKSLLPDMNDLICTDIILPQKESGSVIVGTNYGTILNFTLNKEKTLIKRLMSGNSSSVECLCACPFSDLYFLAAFKDGNIILYSRNISRALMVISNENNKNMNAYCTEIQWSLEKPCIFYTRTSDHTVNLWDLSKSNILPIESKPFEDILTAMKLSPSSVLRQGNIHLMVSTENTIYMYFLSASQKRKNSETHRDEIKTFLNYGNRL